MMKQRFKNAIRQAAEDAVLLVGGFALCLVLAILVTAGWRVDFSSRLVIVSLAFFWIFSMVYGEIFPPFTLPQAWKKYRLRPALVTVLTCATIVVPVIWLRLLLGRW